MAIVVVGCGSSEPAASANSSGAACETVSSGKVTVVTKRFDFSPDCLVSTGSSLTVTYENDESGVPHNFDLLGATLAKGSPKIKLKPGVNTQSTTFVGLKPGKYTYTCDIHRSMVGHLTVKG